MPAMSRTRTPARPQNQIRKIQQQQQWDDEALLELALTFLQERNLQDFVQYLQDWAEEPKSPARILWRSCQEED